jgi:hypothetical protein
MHRVKGEMVRSLPALLVDFRTLVLLESELRSVQRIAHGKGLRSRASMRMHCINLTVHNFVATIIAPSSSLKLTIT